MLSLKNPNETMQATFSLEEGGRLKSLHYANQSVIQDLKNISYENSYASSILFPFANRVCGGNYSFEMHNFQLESNENESKNAIHGLVFNKVFQLKSKLLEDKQNTITFSYIEEDPPKGFPFPFKIDLTYILKNTSLELKIEVENRSEKSFPFTLGWHPYFVVENFNNCVLEFDSSKRVMMNQDLITTSIINNLAPKPYPVETQNLDHCFVLQNNKVSFRTPTYNIELSNSNNSKYLQLYTPPGEERIAIEPMTGISDSFNNKEGLKTLSPKQTFTENWKIYFKP